MNERISSQTTEGVWRNVGKARSYTALNDERSSSRLSEALSELEEFPQELFVRLLPGGL